MSISSEVALILKGQNVATPSIADVTASLKEMQTTVRSVTSTFGTYNTMLTTTIGLNRDATLSYNGLAVSVRSLASAYTELGIAQRTVSTTPPRIAAPVAPTVTRTVAAAETGTVGRVGSVASNAATSDMGLGGRVLGAALSPAGLGVGLTIGGVVYTGLKATQAASDFWSAVAQSAGQANRLQSPSQIRSFGNSILAYESTGKAPYNATTLAQGAEVPLASHYSLSALQQAIPALARLSAQNAAPNLNLADQLVTTIATAAGTGPNSTGKQLISYADFASRAETLTKVPPGGITSAMPTLLSALPGTGVGMNDATAMLLQLATVNPNTKYDAQALRQLLQSTQVKPTAGALSTASSIGLAVGPGSAGLYGGILGWIQALQTASGGNMNTISKILPQKNALAAYNDLLMGGRLTQTAGFSSSLGTATGTGQQVYNELSRGTQQQETQLADRFNGQLVVLGGTINQTVVPALLKLGGKALDAADYIEKTWPKLNPNVGPSTPAGRNAPSPAEALIGQIAWGFQHAVPAAASILGQGAGLTGYALGQVGNAIGSPMHATPSLAASVRAQALAASRQGLEPWRQTTNTLPSPFTRGTDPNSSGAGSATGIAPHANPMAFYMQRTTNETSLAAIQAFVAQQMGGTVQPGIPTGLSTGISAITGAFRGVGNIGGATFGTEQNSPVLGRTVQSLQNAVSIAQLGGNLSALTMAQNALLTYEKEHAGALGIDKSSLALLAAQNQQQRLQSLAGQAQTGLVGLQDKLTLAQLQGNTGAISSIVAAVVAYEKTNAAALGLSPTQLQINALQLQQQTAASVVKALPPQLIRPTNLGAGNTFAANYGASVASLAGGREQNSIVARLERTIAQQAQTIQLLRSELSLSKSSDSSLKVIAAATTRTAANTTSQPTPASRMGMLQAITRHH